MAKFVPGVDEAVKSDEPLLDVAVTADAVLRPGKHVFQLVVTDDAGNQSDVASVTIIVQDTERPTAVVDLIDDNGGRHPEPEQTVPFGRGFRLSGERSTDAQSGGGAIRVWTWTLLRG